MVGRHASSEDAGIGFSMLLSWGTARQGVAIRKDHCCRQSAEVSKATPCNTLQHLALERIARLILHLCTPEI
jgi:hypothetical protein